MCGITGHVHQDLHRQVNRQVLQRMNQVIRHRGPDSDGFFVDGPVGLAARRLAVIDLATGSQPVSNEDGSIQLVFNGEIYNFQELRSRLIEKGHRFRTESDTESVVHLYEEHGPACVDHLRGMFALALWDHNNKRLFLARDRLGKKPLYYALYDGTLIFGSELKCLLQYPGLPRAVNLQAIHHYLSLQYVPDPWSALSAVCKLPPAHWLIWENGKINTHRYWELRYQPKLQGSIQELESELVHRLEEAVRIRLVSDVPRGVHLSGGIDSSIVAALAARLSTKPVKTFSMGFEEERFSELPFARKVAQRYSTDHHEFIVRFGDIPALAQQLVRCFDEPFADPSAIPTYLLAQQTRQHVTVALNGDGGDELFAGYPRYALDGIADAYALLPFALTQKIIPSLFSLVAQPMDRPGEQNWIAGLKRLSQAARTSRKVNFLRWGSFFGNGMKEALWQPDFAADFASHPTPTSSWLESIYDAAPADSHLDRTLFLDTQTYLAGGLLVKADRMTMAHSLEARSPFLDHEFQSWAARLPSIEKLKGRSHKHILKRACAGLLPIEILRRGKQGFGIPLGAWLHGPLRSWMHQRLLHPTAKIRDFFRHQEILRLVTEHLAGRTSHANRLWALLMFELWLEEYA